MHKCLVGIYTTDINSLIYQKKIPEKKIIIVHKEKHLAQLRVKFKNRNEITVILLVSLR